MAAWLLPLLFIGPQTATALCGTLSNRENMISALRKTPAIAAENTIPDDESAPPRLFTIMHRFYLLHNMK